MRKAALVLLMIIYGFIGSAQENRVVYDSSANQSILIGECSWAGFEQDGFSEWFDAGYDAYQPNDSLMARLRELLDDQPLEITVYQATWCPDSRRELPRLKKITDGLKSDVYTEIYSLNRAKRLEKNALPEDDVEFVPTMVFRLDGVEVGRIVESPEYSLEADIVRFLEKQ
ncbi:MAG TPA: thioredoxin family protein [Bacteroidales bacterium]|nr:thioredoxin family protein [Bacteroidales bacterium]